MLKKEVGAIIVALLLVATLGAGVASASGVVIGGGYNDTSLDISSSSFSELFTTDLWNGSFWDSVAEEVEAVENAREARAANETAEESPSFWLPGDKTSWPAGYWNVDPNYQTYWPDGYWDVNWPILQP
ncbi:MAG: hypothetical protein WBE22_09430 [Halobacteriota archaeon]